MSSSLRSLLSLQPSMLRYLSHHQQRWQAPPQADHHEMCLHSPGQGLHHLASSTHLVGGECRFNCPGIGIIWELRASLESQGSFRSLFQVWSSSWALSENSKVFRMLSLIGKALEPILKHRLIESLQRCLFYSPIQPSIISAATLIQTLIPWEGAIPREISPPITFSLMMFAYQAPLSRRSPKYLLLFWFAFIFCIIFF